jgi:hypothetical protein
MVNLKPSVLGLNKSFGFGDRLGLATSGHIEAVKGSSFLPIFAQQSIRELKRTKRKPQEAMNAVINAIKIEKWEGVWGADADHLQTKNDIIQMAKHGYTFFTIDSSEYIDNDVDNLNEEALYQKYYELNRNDTIQMDDIYNQYLGKTYELPDDVILSFYDKLVLIRAILKYSKAIKHMGNMYQSIKKACANKKYEVEISIGETLKPTSPLEHLFIALELKRNNTKFISLAPRFIGNFEIGIDYQGDLKAFEQDYRKHIAIAKYCGPYKISIHSGSDKFSIYPVIGRLSADLLHVKTAGTSYLEALRVVCRTDKKLFYEIINFSRERYQIDKLSYHVSANLSDIPEKIDSSQLEKWYLETNSGRQILHVTYGSILAGVNGKNIWKEKIMENLNKNPDLYKAFLHKHLGKHIKLLSEEL